MVLANSKVEPEGNRGNDLYYTKVKIKPTGAPAAPAGMLILERSSRSRSTLAGSRSTSGR